MPLVSVRSKGDAATNILQATANGDVEYLKGVEDVALKAARCTSGCTALHWAAGCGELEAIRHLVDERSWDVDVPASKKSRGRTPLHYSCRNGRLAAAKLLVDEYGADADARAKHDVSPFQLAVWQGHLGVCRWLVEEKGVDHCQLNEFDCGAVHWLGLCPLGRFEKGRDEQNGSILDLAKWLSGLPGIDFHLRQRQNHTPLHKAAWGGHLDLIVWLRDKQNLWDDVQDDAGNFAADLADMANTPGHSKIASYLRSNCSLARAESCAVLGLLPSATEDDIRRAYLAKVRVAHPDKVGFDPGLNDSRQDFDTIHKAYKHLAVEGGKGSQSNPAHSLPLMLKAQGFDAENATSDDMRFKARLTAVLLEYGDRGLHLCNLAKKWNQVWPDAPFPYDKSTAIQDNGKRMRLYEWLTIVAGDAIHTVVDGTNGSVRVFPRNCSQASVASVAHLDFGAEMSGALPS